jgi:hypothetical protein
MFVEMSVNLEGKVEGFEVEVWRENLMFEIS